MNRFHAAPLMVGLTFTLVACAAEAPIVMAPVQSETQVKLQAPLSEANSGTIRVENKISETCNLPAPDFDFDTADIRGPAAASLDALARCFVDGPLKGQSLRLVGHADPRGELEYNFALGQRRAVGVAVYLDGRGLNRGRIETSSRGEVDAQGSDEAGWAHDRRVDVFLASQ